MSKRRRDGLRPYMLWLTRVYGGHLAGYGTAFLHWPNVLDDWLKRMAEDRFRSESYPRREPRTTSPALSPAYRIRIATGSLPLVKREWKVAKNPRGAGQGER